MASPWLDTREAAELLRCVHRADHPRSAPSARAGEPSRRAFRNFAKRHGLVLRYAGRKALVARADLERLLERRSAAPSSRTAASHGRGPSDEFIR